MIASFLISILLSTSFIEKTYASFLHVWDGKSGKALPERAIHGEVLPSSRSSDIDIASLLPTSTWFPKDISCPDFPEFILVYLNMNPEKIAADIVSKLQVCRFTASASLPQLTDMVADAQLHHYSTILSGSQGAYLKSKGYPFYEGGTWSFLGKMRMMRELVLRPHVKTVCEIGFNNGASTLMWLVSGANKVLSFDIGSHGYTTHAVDWLSQRFPGRFQVILGDSQYTVPSFHQMFPDEKCDLIFIDGGHTYDIALKDLVNFRALAREEKHILLMDDISEPEVARAWNEMIEKGLVLEKERITSHYSTVTVSPFDESLVFRGGRLAEDPASIQQKYDGGMCYGEYTI